jgi:hypothetical protein
MRPLRIYPEVRDFDRLEKWAHERGWTKSPAMRTAGRVLVHDPGEGPLLAAGGISLRVDRSVWTALFAARDRHHVDADGIFRAVMAAKRLPLTTDLVSQGRDSSRSRSIGCA